MAADSNAEMSRLREGFLKEGRAIKHGSGSREEKTQGIKDLIQKYNPKVKEVREKQDQAGAPAPLPRSHPAHEEGRADQIWQRQAEAREPRAKSSGRGGR